MAPLRPITYRFPPAWQLEGASKMTELSFSLPGFTSFNSLLIPLAGENPSSLAAHRALLELRPPSPHVLVSQHRLHHTQHVGHTPALFPECPALSATSKQVPFSPAGTSSSTPTAPLDVPAMHSENSVCFLLNLRAGTVSFSSPLPSS